MSRLLMRVCLVLLLPLTAVSAEEQHIPLFDAHIHYNADVWDALPPARALEKLTEAGITRALVSATPAEGAERLYRLAPARVVPLLRPYASRSARYSWFRDESVPRYVREHLARIPYRGIGEFHVFGDDARTAVVAALIQLAREHRLSLHAHTDRAGIMAILEQAPDIPVIWAHAGFDVPVAALRRLLEGRGQLYLELSFREGITRDGELTPEWEALFADYPQHCLVGMDTYTPGRWAELTDLAIAARRWLLQLPADIAAGIAYGNAERLFSSTGTEQLPAFEKGGS
ncbi:MAG: amidohydrolase family protein [Halobacteria archaeon]|nr:amidohydrolase family protein [Halobacteria archaeon]